MTEETAERRKIGRPSGYTPELGDRILDLFCDGVPLQQICNENEWAPERASIVNRWADLYPEFGSKMALARKLCADALAWKTLEAIKTERDPSRAMVAVRAGQWLASKLDSARFGDRVQVDVEHKLSLADALQQAQGRLRPMSDQSDSDNPQVIDVTPQIIDASRDYKSSDEDLPDFFD